MICDFTASSGQTYADANPSIKEQFGKSLNSFIFPLYYFCGYSFSTGENMRYLGQGMVKKC